MTTAHKKLCSSQHISINRYISVYSVYENVCMCTSMIHPYVEAGLTLANKSGEY